jgi:hypothetical protein
MLLDLVKNSSTTVTQDWVVDLINGTKTLTFSMVGHTYEAHIFNLLIGANQPICKAIFETSIMQMKGQCFTVSNMLVTELDQCFVDYNLMNAFDIVYPQVWIQPAVDFSFSLHMAIIKKHYYQAKKVKPSLLQVVEPLDVNILDF